jgi:hypothetical protein
MIRRSRLGWVIRIPAQCRPLFDIGFVVNRAAIFAVLTGLLIGVFAGLNWLIGTALKSSGLALPADVVLAAGVGLSLHLVQRRVTRFVDRVFFRERYEAESRLHRVARGVPFLEDDSAVSRALIDEPVQALRLSGGALYRRSTGGAFALAASTGWPDDSPQAILASDPLILHVTGSAEALALDTLPHDVAFPTGQVRPRTVIPIPGTNGVAAVALFSAHQSGATLDPDETAAIERIATAASIAFERSRERPADRTLSELRATIESINQRLSALTALLDKDELERPDRSLKALP